MDLKQGRFARFAWGVLAYNVLVILWGAYVRATGAGAGCGSHWPLCNGEVLPRSMAAETLIEFTHRVTSGVALTAVAVMVVWAFRLFQRGDRVRTAAAWSGVFLGVEALLGAGLVLFRFVAQDVSVGRAVYLSLHLVNTQILLAALVLTAWLAAQPPAQPPDTLVRLRRPRALTVALGVALLVSVTGAIAALGDTLFPAASVVAGVRAELSGDAHPLVRLRMVHPAVAVFGAAYLLCAASSAARLKMPGAKSPALAVMLLVFVQLIAGVINVALLAPVWMQLVHLLIADLLWIALVVLSAESTFGGIANADRDGRGSRSGDAGWATQAGVPGRA